MSCADDMTSDRAIKPVQSSAVVPRVVCSRSANQMQAMAANPGGISAKNAIRQPQDSAMTLPRIGPSTGPNTLPRPHSIMTRGWSARENVASSTACAIG